MAFTAGTTGNYGLIQIPNGRWNGSANWLIIPQSASTRVHTKESVGAVATRESDWNEQQITWYKIKHLDWDVTAAVPPPGHCGC